MQTTLSILGAGKVGKALGRLWTRAPALRILDVMNQSLSSAQTAVDFIGAGQAVTGFSSLRPADIYLIATPDDLLAPCCTKLAHTGLLGPESIVFHCSGALTSSALQAAREQGASAASIHPIRSFALPEQVVQNFAGTWCGMEGDDRALSALQPAFTAIGARLTLIQPAAKIHYHAAAVFASNYLVTLMDIASQSYMQAGIAPETALQMLAPLVQETLDNIFRIGPEKALTGPIARGDIATAEKQRQAVAAADPEHGKLYEQFMKLTAELAARRK